MTSPSAPTPGQIVCRVLDPLLTAYGFLPGQAGTSTEGTSVTYCAAQDEFRARFPLLALETDDDHSHACTDLTVEVTHRPAPRLARVSLDVMSVAALVRDAGRADLLPQLAGLGDEPLAAAVERLATVLGAVLAGAEAPGEQQPG